MILTFKPYKREDNRYVIEVTVPRITSGDSVVGYVESITDGKSPLVIHITLDKNKSLSAPVEEDIKLMCMNLTSLMGNGGAVIS